MYLCLYIDLFIFIYSVIFIFWINFLQKYLFLKLIFFAQNETVTEKINYFIVESSFSIENFPSEIITLHLKRISYTVYFYIMLIKYFLTKRKQWWSNRNKIFMFKIIIIWKPKLLFYSWRLLEICVLWLFWKFPITV